MEAEACPRNQLTSIPNILVFFLFPGGSSRCAIVLQFLHLTDVLEQGISMHFMWVNYVQ